MAKSKGLKNGPSKTGNLSGGNRENNPPKPIKTITPKPKNKPKSNK